MMSVSTSTRSPAVAKKCIRPPKNSRLDMLPLPSISRNTRAKTIQEPNLPVVNVGTRSRPVYIPPECCTLLDQHGGAASDLSFGDVADIVSTANIPKWINNVDGKGEIRYPGLKRSLERDLENCEVCMTADSLVVPCRVRDEPVLEYTHGKEVQPLARAWKMDSVTLTPSKNCLRVAVLLIGASQWTASNQVASTIHILRDRMKNHGIALHKIITPHRSVAMEHRKLTKDVQNGIHNELKCLAKDADLVITVLPFEMRPLYDYIKRECDIERGIHNICVIAPQFASNSNGYFFHIALKLNLKSGGQNQVLKADQRKAIDLSKTMVVGINTIAPPTKSANGAKGVAAIVASIDGTLSQWPADFQILDNKPLHETLCDLLKTLLELWKEKHGSPPQTVIVYRTGLSPNSCAEEISSFQKIHNTKMTLIAVNKDHCARIEPLPASYSSLNPSASSKNTGIIIRTKLSARAWEFVLQGNCPPLPPPHQQPPKTPTPFGSATPSSTTPPSPPRIAGKNSRISRTTCAISPAARRRWSVARCRYITCACCVSGSGLM